MSPDQVAAVFLLLLVGGVAGAIVTAFHHSPFTFAQSILFAVATVLARVLWRADLPRELPLAPGQGAILVSNHRSSIDPFFIQVCVDRPTHYMVAREFCERPAFSWFLTTIEVIPTNRGGIDTRATKTAMRYAAKGDFVGMFPEGRINVTDEFMLPVRPGAILIALKAGAPILPYCILGSPYRGTAWSPFFMSARVRLRVGELIDVTEYRERDHDAALLHELMTRVVREIARLAGEEDFEPRFAGRSWMPSEAELRTHLKDAQRRSRRQTTI